LDEISTLKAKLLTVQSQLNAAEVNHQAEIQQIEAMNADLNTKMKDEIGDLKKEKMQMLTQSQNLLAKNVDLKKNLAHMTAKS
jgi:HAMP domain-containing protein